MYENIGKHNRTFIITDICICIDTISKVYFIKYIRIIDSYAIIFFYFIDIINRRTPLLPYCRQVQYH